MHSIVKKVFLLVHGFSSVCHDFLNVKKVGIEEALQICEHLTTALSNYYCHIMYFSLRLPISLSSSLCPFFNFFETPKISIPPFVCISVFLTLLLQSIPKPVAAATGRQSGYPVFCVN